TFVKKDYKATVAAQYNITDTIKVGAAYNVTGYRTSFSDNVQNNNDLGRQTAHSASVGLNYTKSGIIAGVTGSLQNYKYNVVKNSVFDRLEENTTAFGVEAGVSYDISGQGTGFRPQVQFDYKRSYNKE